MSQTSHKAYSKFKNLQKKSPFLYETMTNEKNIIPAALYLHFGSVTLFLTQTLNVHSP